MFYGRSCLLCFNLICCLIVVAHQDNLGNFEACQSRTREVKVYLTRGSDVPLAMQPYRIYYGEECFNSRGNDCSYVNQAALPAGERAVCEQYNLLMGVKVDNYTSRHSFETITVGVLVPAGCICEIVESK